MQQDAWFFVGIFVFIFIFWVAIGGPAHPISFTGPTLALPDELGGGTYLTLPRAPFGINGSSWTRPATSGSSNSSSYGSPSLQGLVFGDPSPFTNLITMNRSVSSASSTDSRREYVRFSLSRTAPNPINITGWRLVSEITGKAAVIPRGASTPRAWSVNPMNDIVLSPGDTVYVTTGGPPLGVSFRENKCTGYLSQFQDFTPSLKKTCPSALDEYKTYGGAGYARDTTCYEYMKRIPRCQTTLSPPDSLSRSCKDFIKTYLTYNGCVAYHGIDPDFTGTIWHVYLGYSKPLWRARTEVLKLLDQSFKTVSAISY